MTIENTELPRREVRACAGVFDVFARRVQRLCGDSCGPAGLRCSRAFFFKDLRRQTAFDASAPRAPRAESGVYVSIPERSDVARPMIIRRRSVRTQHRPRPAARLRAARSSPRMGLTEDALAIAHRRGVALPRFRQDSFNHITVTSDRGARADAMASDANFAWQASTTGTCRCRVLMREGTLYDDTASSRSTWAIPSFVIASVTMLAAAYSPWSKRSSRQGGARRGAARQSRHP